MMSSVRWSCLLGVLLMAGCTEQGPESPGTSETAPVAAAPPSPTPALTSTPEKIAVAAQAEATAKLPAPDAKPAPAAAPSESPEKASAPAKSAEPATPKPAPAAAAAAPAATGSDAGVTLQLVKFDEFLDRIRANKQAKYTLVDVWATWCGPCKENFPHLIEMSQKYGSPTMAFASLSFDDPSKPKGVKEATEFLKEKKAVFPNFLLNESDMTAGFDKLDIGTIPAVFIFTPDGKVFKKFTMDDPNNQFTYADVEKVVVELVGGKGTGGATAAEPAGK